MTSEQFSQELQLNFSTDEVFNTPFKVDGILAAYYFNEDSFEDNRTGLSPVRVPVAQAGLTTQRVILFGDGKSESWAVFGNATIHFNDQIGLKLGGRFTHESRSVDNSGTIVVANGLGPTIRQALADDRSFSDFTPEIGLEWKPAEDVMLYYTYSEGFKTGAGVAGFIGLLGHEWVTLGNLFCGYACVIYAMRGEYAVAPDLRGKSLEEMKYEVGVMHTL